MEDSLNSPHTHYSSFLWIQIEVVPRRRQEDEAVLVHTFLNSRSTEGAGKLESKEEKKSPSSRARRLSWIDDKNSLDTIERPVRGVFIALLLKPTSSSSLMLY